MTAPRHRESARDSLGRARLLQEKPRQAQMGTIRPLRPSIAHSPTDLQRLPAQQLLIGTRMRSPFHVRCPIPSATRRSLLTPLLPGSIQVMPPSWPTPRIRKGLTLLVSYAPIRTALAAVQELVLSHRMDGTPL